MFDFNEHTEWILGRPNFWCASMIVPALRASGQEIATNAEAEQAAAIWMPDELHTYKEGYLLKFVIEKLQNSF